MRCLRFHNDVFCNYSLEFASVFYFMNTFVPFILTIACLRDSNMFLPLSLTFHLV